LDGNHHTAESGSCAATPPSGVRCQAVYPSMLSSDGLPAYFTTTETDLPLASGAAGVISSSWVPVLTYFAFVPLTLTSLTASPKSRLKRERFCVVVARIVAVPSRRSVVGWYFSRRS
jgi:hypothetical protein